MNRMSRTICCAVCLSAVMLQAAEIVYTGGGASASDLTDPVNWGGTQPGPEDLAVVDLSLLTGASVVLSADWSIKGLSFVNGGSSRGIWLGRKAGTSPRLTLGASGLTIDALYSFYVQVPVTLSAEQTWTMGDSMVHFDTNGGVSGTVDWTVTGFKRIDIDRTLNYGGKILYDQAYNPVWNHAAGRWAQSVAFCRSGSSGERPVLNLTSGTSSVSEMFGDRVMNFMAGPTMLDFGRYGHADAFATYKIEDGDTVQMAHTYSTLAGGDLQMTGGTFTPGTYFDLGVDKDTFGSKGPKTNAARFLIAGGLFDPVYFGVGRWHASYGEGGSTKRVVQTAGTVGQASRAYALLVGGGPSASEGLVPEPLAEYRLEGGTLNFPNVNQSEHGLALSCNNETSVGTIPGVFTQTGGVAVIGEVQFGSRQNGHWGTVAAAKPNVEGFGLFDLAGGTFTLGENGFTLVPKWNVGGSESNAAYKVRLRGGKLLPLGMQTNPLAVDVTGNATSVVQIAAEDAFVQDGPVRGAGVLCKKGAGTLVLRDATRFTGDLIVEEGRVLVEGAAPVLDGGYIWTADDATDGLEDGASVASWSDTSDTYTAGANTFANYTLLPTAIKDAFNGHAAVRFGYDADSQNSASLKFPGGQNALCGLTNFTVVVVARPARTETTANGASLTSSTWLWCDQILGNAINNTPAFFSLNFTKDGATAGCYFGSSGELPRCSVVSDMQTDVTSVIICSRRGNVFEINVNGVMSNHCYTAFSGNTENWNGDTSKPLYLACNGLGANRGFKGDLAEFRIYRDRVLTAAEKESLVLSLLEKYESSAARVTEKRQRRTWPTADTFGRGTVPEMPSGGAAWDAAALAELEPPEGAGRPTLVTDVLGGKSVLRFDGTQALAIPAAESPVSGASAFTAAVVFRADEPGVDENVYAGGLGLLSTKQAGADAADFVLSWRHEGALGAGYGTTDGNAPLFSFKPCRLDDGEGHIAVFAVDPHAGVMRLMTDGRLVTRPLTLNETRGAYEVLVGSLLSTSGRFKGDLAAVRLYPRALSETEMSALSEAWADEYRIGLLGRFAYAADELTAHGLSARGVTVAEGATLVLPDSAAGWVLADGMSLAKRGTVLGRLTCADGAVIDVDWDALPLDFDALAVSGNVTIRVNGVPENPDVAGRINLLRIGSLTSEAGQAWRIAGISDAAEPVWDEATGCVFTRLPRRFILLVR